VEELVVEVVGGGELGCVGVAGGLEEGEEEGVVEVERVVGEGVFEEERGVVSCAKEEVGRIHERKRRVEESCRVDRGQWQMFLKCRDSIF
jgi:hypothetical protein